MGHPIDLLTENPYCMQEDHNVLSDDDLIQIISRWLRGS